MTTCDAVEPRLDAWLDGELSAAEQDELAAHLKTCPSCRQAHGELRQTKAALGRFFHHLQEEAPAVPSRRLPGWLLPCLAAAAMVLLMLLTRERQANPLEGLISRLAHAATQVRDHGTLQVKGPGGGVLRIAFGGERLYWEQRDASDTPIRRAGGFDHQEIWTYDADRQEVLFVESTGLSGDHPELRRWPPLVWSCRQLLDHLAGSALALAHVEVRHQGDLVEATLSPGSEVRERGRLGSATLQGDDLVSLSGSNLVGAAAWEGVVWDATPDDARPFGWRERFPDARPRSLTADDLEELQALGYVDDG